MNTAMPLAVRSISPQTALRAAALATLFSFASVAVFADQPWAPAAATRAAKVSLSGLDLSTAEGAHIAYERINGVLLEALEWLKSIGIHEFPVHEQGIEAVL